MHSFNMIFSKETETDQGTMKQEGGNLPRQTRACISMVDTNIRTGIKRYAYEEEEEKDEIVDEKD